MLGLGLGLNSRGTPASSTPLSILGAGNVRWWMTTPTGLADNDPVSTWPDGSPNANHGTASGEARPLYKATGMNGKPCLSFDGSDIVSLTNQIDYTAASAITIYAVGTSGGFAFSRAFAGCRTASVTAYLFACKGTTGALAFWAGPFNVISTLVFPTGSLTLAGVEADFVGRTIRFQLDGSTETLAMPSGSPGSPGVVDNPCGDPTGGAHWSGTIADVLNTSIIPTASQRQQLIDWYKAKYGLSF